MPSDTESWAAPDAKQELAQENINDLARIIASEARGLSEAAQTLVGWTVVNRMKQRHLTRVSEVWVNGNYAQGHFPTATSLRLAEGILDGRVLDNSQGATHFYSPASMPKEHETASFRADVSGGLESVPGVTKSGRPVRNYRPGWAQWAPQIRTPGIPEKDFKFYRAP